MSDTSIPQNQLIAPTPPDAWPPLFAEDESTALEFMEQSLEYLHGGFDAFDMDEGNGIRSAPTLAPATAALPQVAATSRHAVGVTQACSTFVDMCVGSCLAEPPLSLPPAPPLTLTAPPVPENYQALKLKPRIEMLSPEVPSMPVQPSPLVPLPTNAGVHTPSNMLLRTAPTPVAPLQVGSMVPPPSKVTMPLQNSIVMSPPRGNIMATGQNCALGPLQSQALHPGSTVLAGVAPPVALQPPAMIAIKTSLDVPSSQIASLAAAFCGSPTAATTATRTSTQGQLRKADDADIHNTCLVTHAAFQGTSRSTRSTCLASTTNTLSSPPQLQFSNSTELRTMLSRHLGARPNSADLRLLLQQVEQQSQQEVHAAKVRRKLRMKKALQKYGRGLLMQFEQVTNELQRLEQSAATTANHTLLDK